MLSLLFVLAHWHGLAKLRTHTDHTLKILDDRTSDLGSDFRAFFKDVCQNVSTKELKRESEARKRREAKKSQKTKAKPAATKKAPATAVKQKATVPRRGKTATRGSAKSRGQPSSSEATKPSTKSDDALSNEQRDVPNPPPAKKRKVDSAGETYSYCRCLGSISFCSFPVEEPAPVSSAGLKAEAQKAKTFSLHTFKFHALGHVVTNIKRFGCSDNYSTQGVSYFETTAT